MGDRKRVDGRDASKADAAEAKRARDNAEAIRVNRNRVERGEGTAFALGKGDGRHRKGS